ncbi:transposase [Streptomyces sp. NPDC002838]|uniref:transposase n=1 Tax=Streptomyces sp. NPDC002838 TaxID=3154436 RepID=UPI00332AF11F
MTRHYPQGRHSFGLPPSPSGQCRRAQGRQAGRKVHVIADRHPVHRGKAVRTWLDEHADRVELHLMPGYSPELNPNELLTADIKRHVHASRAHSTDDLAHETRRFPRRRQRQPRTVRGYLSAGPSESSTARNRIG